MNILTKTVSTLLMCAIGCAVFADRVKFTIQVQGSPNALFDIKNMDTDSPYYKDCPNTTKKLGCKSIKTGGNCNLCVSSTGKHEGHINRIDIRVKDGKTIKNFQCITAPDEIKAGNETTIALKAGKLEYNDEFFSICY